MHHLGIEPGPPVWQVSILPLNQRCTMFCEVSNYTIAIPLFREDSLSIAEAILNKVVYQFGPPSMIIIDEGRAMSSEVMTYIYEALRIKPIVISPENHGSLRTERYIRTISEMLTKYIYDKVKIGIYISMHVFMLITHLLHRALDIRLLSWYIYINQQTLWM